MRQLVPYKKEVKLQHLTVVQHQKVYDTQRSKMKHMHVNFIMHIILKKKKGKGRVVQHQKCIVHNGLQLKMKTKKYSYKNKNNTYTKTTYSFVHKKKGNVRVVQHQKVYNARRSSILVVVILVTPENTIK